MMIGIFMLCIEWLQRERQHPLQLPTIGIFNYRLVRWSIYYVLILLIINYAGSSQTFIYFQF